MFLHQFLHPTSKLPIFNLLSLCENISNEKVIIVSLHNRFCFFKLQ